MPSFNVSEVFGFLGDTTSFCVNATFDCSDDVPPCNSPKGFTFASMWNITLNYYGLCKSQGAWLFDPRPGLNLTSPALSNAACKVIAGEGMTTFPKADIWSRLTTWKFPLIQLIASSPRPPLGLLIETFAVLHLTSDPIGSLRDALWKVDCCQRRAGIWRDHFRTRSDIPDSEKQKLAKALALITESYAELGPWFGEDAERALKAQYPEENMISELASTNFMEECYITSGALAADRATTIFPVVIAELIFISIFFIDMIRLQSSSVTKATNFVNIEMHSIGFSALFFWLISTVMVTATIGTSQTPDAIPRILRRFKRDLLHKTIALALPDSANFQAHDRWRYGGIYSWQPLQYNRHYLVQQTCEGDKKLLTGTSLSQKLHRSLLRNWPWILSALPWAVFICAVGTGMLISGWVPPGGWTCRSNGELYFVVAWVVSHVISRLIGYFSKAQHYPTMFYVLFAKDLIFTCAVIGWILATQMGFYNRCDCYSGWGRTGLTLPEQPETYKKLQAGLHFGGSFLSILVVGIFLQVIVFPGLLAVRYWTAIEVFRQRDDQYSASAATQKQNVADDSAGLLTQPQDIPLAPSPGNLDAAGSDAQGSGVASGAQRTDSSLLTFSRTGTASRLA